MVDRDIDDLRCRAIQQLDEIGERACNTTNAEAALGLVTRASFDLLGDRHAHHRTGALKPGEQQFFVSGIFLITPAVDSHLLIAEHGFPPEQHRLRIPIDTGHPGWVYQYQRPCRVGRCPSGCASGQIAPFDAVLGLMPHQRAS